MVAKINIIKMQDFWIGRIIIIKMFIQSKAVYEDNVISIKMPLSFFTEIEKTVLKFVWNHKRLHNSQSSLVK